MTGRDTKTLILEKSLQLFSERGYDGVRVREIAAAVGIRESALYKHFAGKQDIFDSLLAEMQRRYEEAVITLRIPQGSIPQIATQYQQGSLDFLKKAGESMFLYWLKDPYASQFRRMLSIEQFKNGKAAQTYHSFFFDEVLSFQTELFAQMIQNGYFKPGDPSVMAIQFYAPFFLLFHRYDGQPEQEQSVLRLLAQHIEAFENQHSVKPRNTSTE